MYTPMLKDPDAVLDYGFLWSKWLNGDTISTSSWTIDSELTETDSTHTAGTTTVWLSGGECGKTYKVINHIVTANGREEDRTLFIKVEER